MVQSMNTTLAQQDIEGIGQIGIVLKNGKVSPLSPDSCVVSCPHIMNQTPVGFRSGKRFSLGFFSGDHCVLGSNVESRGVGGV